MKCTIENLIISTNLVFDSVVISQLGLYGFESGQKTGEVLACLNCRLVELHGCLDGIEETCRHSCHSEYMFQIGFIHRECESEDRQ